MSYAGGILLEHQLLGWNGEYICGVTVWLLGFTGCWGRVAGDVVAGYINVLMNQLRGMNPCGLVVIAR